MRGLSHERLQTILDSLKSIGVMVVGDFALDAYWYADMVRSELSRETPHYTRPITRETYSPGASGNICCNVAALAVRQVFAVTAIGQDWRGRILSEELRKNGVRVEGIIESKERVTSTYIKPMLCGLESQQEDARLDFVNTHPLPKAVESQLLERVVSTVKEVDVVIVEDQMVNNGVVTEGLREKLSQLAEERPEKVFVCDSRERIGLFRNMVMKPNRMEAVRAVQPSREPKNVGLAELKQIGLELHRRARRPVYITLSDEGALVVTDGVQEHLPAARTKPPIDPVGAGDTFITALGASLSVGADAVEAGIIANIAAGVVVKKLNITGTATRDEILRKFEESSAAGVWP